MRKRCLRRIAYVSLRRAEELDIVQDVHLFRLDPCPASEKIAPCEHEVQALKVLIFQGSKNVGLDRSVPYPEIDKAETPVGFAVCHNPEIRK